MLWHTDKNLEIRFRKNYLRKITGRFEVKATPTAGKKENTFKAGIVSGVVTERIEKARRIVTFTLDRLVFGPEEIVDGVPVEGVSGGEWVVEGESGEQIVIGQPDTDVNTKRRGRGSGDHFT